MEQSPSRTSLNFIESIIVDNIQKNGESYSIHTRFPPEPNGYLHIGHAKSICFNFGLAEKYTGLCNLRFDDTNPIKEEVEYVDSIKEDVRWLGFSWDDREYYASDYFDQLYEWAIVLIKKGVAYVCDLDTEDFAKNYKGTPTQAGKFSPYRNRGTEENLELFQQMKDGKFRDGERVLRAKIDMASPNMHMRDPVMYRIKHAHHHRTGNKWCIYPMYDWAHGQSDYIENITHSICTLEFEVHRPLYDWFLDQFADRARPRQIEFARLNLSYTVMSKRKLLQLVEEKLVYGWNDPRMPTISGLRRRGYTPDSIRNFANTIGVAKRDNVIDVALLEHSVREDLNKKAQRLMAVIDPLKVVITNYPENHTEKLEALNNPENPEAGCRQVPFSKTLYIEKNDFMEKPPRKFFRLSPGKEVRLRYAYFITCTDVIKDTEGNIKEIHCTYDPASKGGKSPDGRKVKGTLHWVSAKESVDTEVRLYDRLFDDPDPDGHKDKDFKSFMNPHSLEVINNCKVEPGIKTFLDQKHFQFERLGYFYVDPDTTEANIVLNRTVSLKDSWSKIQNKV